METIETVYLLGAEHSLFTGKLRSYLRYKRIPHELVPASLRVMKDFILPVVGWSVIPIVVVNFTDKSQRVIQDTAVVMDFFEGLSGHVVPSIHPSGAKQRLASEILTLLGDEMLAVLIGMYFRWTFPEENEKFLVNEWQKVLFPEAHLHGSVGERNMARKVSEKSRQAFGGLLPVLGITEASVGEVKVLAERFLGSLNRHLETHEFLLGGRPCMADFSFMGLLYAHLFRDPASGMRLKGGYPRVAEYVEKLSLNVFPIRETNVHVDEEGRYRFEAVERQNDDWVANDSIPETLLPVFDLFFRCHLPLLQSSLELLREYKQSCSEVTEELPTILGMSPLEIDSLRSQRIARTFEIWKLQNVLDVRDGLPAKEVEAWLNGFGDPGRVLACLDARDVRVMKDTNGPCKASTLYFALESKSKL